MKPDSWLAGSSVGCQFIVQMKYYCPAKISSHRTISYVCLYIDGDAVNEYLGSRNNPIYLDFTKGVKFQRLNERHK
jgi:hypothetical protein